MPDSSEATRGARSGGWLVTRLAVMMLLQFWPLGCWWITVNAFVAENTGSAGSGMFSGWFLGFLGSTMAIGALVTPGLLGWVADRFVPANRLLFLLHGVAAASLWWIHDAESQAGFYAAMVVYFQALTPSFSLTFAVAMGSLKNPQQEFPAVRLYGTVSWVLAGLFLGVVCPEVLGIESIDKTRLPFAIAGWSHLVMAAYSLTLPAGTRAGRAGERESEAGQTGFLTLLTNPAAVGFLFVSILVASSSQPYNVVYEFLNQSGDERAAATLTLGQLTEVVCLGCLSRLKRRFSLKLLFTLGVGAWAVRYALLEVATLCTVGWGSMTLIYGAILLHGPAFAFVYVVGQQYLDKLAPESRGVGQGIHIMATGGIGHLAGAALGGWSQSVFLTPEGVDPAPYCWAPFWFAPVIPTTMMGLLFWFWFGAKVDDAEA